MNINPMNFIHSMKYMLSGMVTIFAVIAAIAAAVVILNKVSYYINERSLRRDK